MFKILNAKRVTLGMLTLVGAYWIVESLKLELWVRNGPGGGFLPLLAGILCVGFSVGLLAKEWNQESKTHFDVKALIPIGALLAVLLCSYLLGVMLSVVLFIFLWLYFFEKFPLKNCISVAIFWPTVLYAVFVLWLQAPLPKGLLGIL